MKKLALAGVLALALLALAGCASCPDCNPGQWIDAQVDGARDWLADPQTQAAAATLKSGATAFVCAIASAAAEAEAIEQAEDAGTAVIDKTGKVLTGSSMVCESLGGTVNGTATVP